MESKNWVIPALFTTIISSLLIITVPVKFEKYSLDHLRTYEGMIDESYAFADVNGDGDDEIILCGGTNTDGTRDNSCGIRVLEDSDFSSVDQLNVNELIIGQQQVIISDYDHDDYDEVSLIGVDGGAIFLYMFERPDLNEPILKIRLDSIARERGKPILNVTSAFQKDVNRDSYDEVFFYLAAGFSIYPRRNYRLDIEHKSLQKGPISSTGFCADNTRSSSLEFFTGRTNSAGNHEDSIDLPYPDLYSYAYVLGEDLQFLFEPEVCAAYPDDCSQVIIDDHLFVLGKIEGVHFLQKRLIYTGEVEFSKELGKGPFWMTRHGEELVLTTNGELIFLNKNVEETKRVCYQELGFKGDFIDINGDGLDEYLSKVPHRNVVNIFSADIDHPVQVDIGVSKGSASYLFRRLKNSAQEFVVHKDDQLDFYSYHYNPYFWLRWPYYFLVYLLTGLVSTILFRRFRKSIENKYEQERQLSKLQLLSIKNQVDPHFTLNALNSIDWMYRNNETEKASSFMGKLSRLMNQTVQSSDKIGCTLYEELDFCRNYCELEMLRGDDFNYSIDIDESIDPFEIELPKQLVFTHVENAIKHGLRPKEGEKQLSIKVAKTATGVEITVTDNGVGFSQNSKTSGTGKGLKIAEEMVELWERLKGVTVEVQIEPERDAPGTKVRICLQI